MMNRSRNEKRSGCCHDEIDQAASAALPASLVGSGVYGKSSFGAPRDDDLGKLESRSDGVKWRTRGEEWWQLKLSLGMLDVWSWRRANPCDGR